MLFENLAIFQLDGVQTLSPNFVFLLLSCL
nr:MAG TPA: hypothetical protein [Caudoviricetes sp.]